MRWETHLEPASTCPRPMPLTDPSPASGHCSPVGLGAFGVSWQKGRCTCGPFIPVASADGGEWEDVWPPGRRCQQGEEVDGRLLQSILARATQGHSHLTPLTELMPTGPWDHHPSCLTLLRTHSMVSMRWRSKLSTLAGEIEHGVKSLWGRTGGRSVAQRRDTQ